MFRRANHISCEGVCLCIVFVGRFTLGLLLHQLVMHLLLSCWPAAVWRCLQHIQEVTCRVTIGLGTSCTLVRFLRILTASGWNTGRVHAMRIKSFLRFLVTEDAKLEMPVIVSDDNATDARQQTTVQAYHSIKPLPEPLVESLVSLAGMHLHSCSWCTVMCRDGCR